MTIEYLDKGEYRVAKPGEVLFVGMIDIFDDYFRVAKVVDEDTLKVFSTSFVYTEPDDDDLNPKNVQIIYGSEIIIDPAVNNWCRWYRGSLTNPN